MPSLYPAMKGALRSAYGSYLRKNGDFSRFREAHSAIVAFHRVNDELDDTLTCSTSKFERFCRFFKSNFDVIALEELIHLLNQGKPVGGKLVITFDDGYRDNFLHAAPILAREKLDATFFVTSGFVGHDNTAWWDQKSLPPPPWMSWTEVKMLHKAGFTIGSHTVHHADLGQVSPQEAKIEIVESKKMIQEQIHAPINLFAYPYGGEHNVTHAVRQIVRESGFSCCLSCHGGIVEPGADPFSLKRMVISEWYTKPEQLIADLVHESRVDRFY